LWLVARIQLNEPIEEQPHDIALGLGQNLAVHIRGLSANADPKRAAGFRYGGPSAA
jgi:hypothetical protein